MAGTGRAAVNPLDVHILNPASLVHVRDRDIHAVFANRGWLVGMTDNTLGNLFAGALSYSSIKTDFDDRSEVEHRDLRLSLAGFATETFSVGATLHQLEIKDPFDNKVQQNNADLGFSYVVGPRLGLAAVVSDIVSSSLEPENPFRLRPRGAVGMNYLINQMMSLRADVVSAPEIRFGKPAVLLGYESAFNRFVAARIGWGHDADTKQEFASAGLGINLPRFWMNYAYQGGIRGGFEARQSLDLGIPF